MTSLPEAVREMAELRHSASAMNYASFILGLIEAESQLTRLRNKKDPSLSLEQQSQREMIFDIILQIVRNEVKMMFRSYFIPEMNKWLEAAPYHSGT